MGLPQPVRTYTAQEYYQLERDAEYRSEYYQGEIFAMAGNTTPHSQIVMNIGGELRSRLKGKPCMALDSNQRLRIKSTGLRCYPDVSIYCGPLEYDQEDDQRHTALNPTVLFEVLAESTERYDRVFKSMNYRQISSLKAYVLVSQDKPHVEMYQRQADNTWLLSEATGLDASIELPDTGVSLPLVEMYDRVVFSPATLRRMTATT